MIINKKDMLEEEVAKLEEENRMCNGNINNGLSLGVTQNKPICINMTKKNYFGYIYLNMVITDKTRLIVPLAFL